MEYTMLLIANSSELHENQFALISQQCMMLHLLVTLAKKFLNHAAQCGEELPVNMLNFSYGNLKMGKFISQVFANLTSKHPDGNCDVQEVCVKSGFGQLICQII